MNRIETVPFLFFILKRFFKTVGVIVALWVITVVGIRIFGSLFEPNTSRYSIDSFEVIAHGGGQGDMPANTLEAMKKAIENGADVLELDIHMSRDSHIVVIHDKTLDRTTDCTGMVKDKSLKELQRCDKGYYFSPIEKYSNRRDKSAYSELQSTNTVFTKRGKGIKIPILRSILTEFPKRKMIIEIKQQRPSLVPRFCQLIHELKFQDQIIVGSFYQESLDQFRKVCPDVLTSASLKEGIQYVLAEKIFLTGILSPEYELLQLPQSIKISSNNYIPDFSIVNRSLIRKAHRQDMLVQVWTINNKTLMKTLIEDGVDGIMTDYPSRLRDLAKEFQSK